MKIAVVGCGAVGSFYGAKLCRTGHEVHFLLRSDYDVVRREGVLVRSIHGDFRVRPRSAARPEEIGVSELVLIGLKTTANDQFPLFLPRLVGPDTAVMTLQNGLGNEERLARIFPAGQILGGLCFVCLNRVAPGVIQHTDHGLVVIGEFQGHATPRTHALAAMFRDAAVECRVTDDLRRAHWEKLVWNIPFNGLGVAGAAGYAAVIRGHLAPGQALGPVLTTDLLLAEPRWQKLLRDLMLEVIAAARGLGLEIPDTCADENLARTRTMGAYKASTLLDFEYGRPLELQSLFGEPLRQAQQAGVATPRLAALGVVLEQMRGLSPLKTGA
jgi:2-dehydropantoate 2-reductase